MFSHWEAHVGNVGVTPDPEMRNGCFTAGKSGEGGEVESSVGRYMTTMASPPTHRHAHPRAAFGSDALCQRLAVSRLTGITLVESKSCTT